MAADINAQIEAIEAALASNVSKVSYDGQSVEYRSRADMLAELDRLKLQRDGEGAVTSRGVKLRIRNDL